MPINKLLTYLTEQTFIYSLIWRHFNSTMKTPKIKYLISFFLLILPTITVFQVQADDLGSNKSLTYAEVIAKYKALDSLYEDAKMITYGRTDCGVPLHLFVITTTHVFDPWRLHELNKCVLFINNGIHPGEPDGIDASIQLATDLLSKPLYKRLLENVVVCIIPVFNIDGALQRSCCSRANQNGPDEYGFRANALNLDLNRDFVKSDSKSTKTMINILRQWDPDVIVDTHVSDGADYQYTMTLIAEQHNKLQKDLGKFMHQKLTPALYSKMKELNDEMSPYIQHLENQSIPDSGIVAFLETPRYLCGYASLFHAFCYTSEAHMLKPFYQRKKSTYNLLSSFVELCDEYGEKIIETRKLAISESMKKKYYLFNWKCDTAQFELMDFKGYEARFKASTVTDENRLYYDRTKPYKKKIRYYNSYYASDSIAIPRYIYIPQAYDNLIQLLHLNGIEFNRMQMDSTATVTATFITDYKTVSSPAEGHYLHYNIKTRTQEREYSLHKNDYLISLPQKNMGYILETLTSRASDSYFCWGFFDSFLQQKEWFSDYLYEDQAADLLQKDPQLKADFEKWKSENPGIDAYSKLNYIYRNSNSFEKTYMRYPVFFIY